MNANDSQALKSYVEKKIGKVQDPETGRSLGTQGQVKSVSVDDATVEVKLGLTTFSSLVHDDVVDQVRDLLAQAETGEREVAVEVLHHDRPAVQVGQAGLTAKAVIGVGSGKGGVGKSTLAAGLAQALHKSGAKVGLLDTDVYGPSVPTLTGVGGQPAIVENKIEPLDWNGIPVMSIGFLVPPNEAVIWRGPMLHQTVTRFVRDVAWGDLDFLIVDMPPGTGDVAITLSQLVPITGSIVVCTPQDVALADAIKAVGMFRKVKIPILGVVENMSGFICPGCSKEYEIFGKGGAREYSSEEGLPFLGALPINMTIRESGDEGQLSGLMDDPHVGPRLTSIAYQLVRHLADQAIQSPPTPTLPVLG
ncbi:MAG: Mrp/NBP35 family ATP-binding protein [Planctomycetota bacterium]|nr:Mrp/NBP35 family ATP-binding protein [Planctomycetota bacterium]